MSYCSNFYLMFLVNSLFRGAFYSIFVRTNKTKRPNNNNNNNNNNTNKQVVITKNNTKTRKNTTGINAETRENKSKE